MNNKIFLGILFVLLATWVCFFAGLAFGGLITPKSSGLAGGAAVFFYGIIGAFIGLAGSILASIQFSIPILKRLLMIAGVLTLLSGVWVAYRIQVKASEKKEQPLEPKRPLKPTAPAQNFLLPK